MGKLITWLVALIVLGAAVWFLFLRDATDKAAEKAQDPVKLSLIHISEPTRRS